MYTVTSDYKRTEQNGEPHSNPSSVTASYSKQLASNYYEQQEFTIMMTPNNSEAEVPTA